MPIDIPPSQSASSEVFRYFGRSLVLNLDADVQRMQEASARLCRLGIPFERFAAVPVSPNLQSHDPRFSAGHYACALSHRAMLDQAWKRADQRLLIFEDDVILRDDTVQWLGRILPQLQRIAWDVFYLGLHLVTAGEQRGQNLLGVESGFHTHAYAVSRQAIPRIIAWIDQVLSRRVSAFDEYGDPSLLKVCAVPILAVQAPNTSHTHGRFVNRFSQYFTRFDEADFARNCQELVFWMDNTQSRPKPTNLEGYPHVASDPQ